jgi:hypothetical protein
MSGPQIILWVIALAVMALCLRRGIPQAKRGPNPQGHRAAITRHHRNLPDTAFAQGQYPRLRRGARLVCHSHCAKHLRPPAHVDDGLVTGGKPQQVRVIQGCPHARGKAGISGPQRADLIRSRNAFAG